jgi:hypothetical protein
VPKHPVINPELDKAIEYEKQLDYDNLIDECIKNIEIIKITKQEQNELL